MKREMIRLMLWSACLWIAGGMGAGAQTGPMVGTVTRTEAYFLYRPGAVEKPLRLEVLGAGGGVVASSEATSEGGNDYVAKFHVSGLQENTAYTYRIQDLSGGEPQLVAGPELGLTFRTRMAQGAKGMVTAAFVSCANATSEPVWERIGTLAPDQLILAGDTPYIDVADLPTIRLKQRSFLETPFMASLIRGTSAVGTWDDHDFGLNNGNGVNAADRRVATRRGFVEYRAHDQYGDGSAGVYHRVELGTMDIFLLDPRWFSQTGPSPVDPAKKTCFGAVQWQWIRQQLEASKAPFKVLLMGQVWEDKKNGENDDMYTYWYERDALYDWIREKQIPGVVLVGGDIHVSRHLIHRRRIGYDLHDFVTSPAHTSVIPSLDVMHPALEWSAQEPRQFLTLTADTRQAEGVLTARFYLADGTVLREVVIPYEELVAKDGQGLGRELRAWWSFDGDLKNHAATGDRFDAVAVNGASLVADGGLKGGAVRFERASQQYLRIGRQVLNDSAPLPERAGRNPLDDNGRAYTASLWCKAGSLPVHGGTERHFLMESALGGSDDPGYVVSVGLRSSETDASKVRIELYTVTLRTTGTASTAQPTPVSQGPFAYEVERSVLTDQWAHVAATFDGERFRLYLNGAEAAQHVLPTPGPAAETAGLILGGHREGTGRNFDGMMDEVALWSRVLEANEIAELYHSGQPQTLPTGISAADGDGDSMEDWWEILHGLDPEDPQDAMMDPDGDGVPSWLERRAGTSPKRDDSMAFDYLRQMIEPGQEFEPLLFRNPLNDSLRLRLRLQGSEDLETWLPVNEELELEGGIEGGIIRLGVTPESSARGFFRIEPAAPAEISPASDEVEK